MISKDMSTQKEWRLDNFPGELRKLRSKMESFLPGYLAALRRLGQMPEEFKRRFWVSRVDSLVEKVKADYRNYELETFKANLLGKMTGAMVNMASQAVGQQPIVHTGFLQACLSISPTGRIQPDLLHDFSKQYDAIRISIEKFEAIAQKLEDKIMEGDTLPESEDEIPKLIYKLALDSLKGLPDHQP
jgi:hypothetical protein